MRSAGWQSIADLPIGAHRGLQHHRGIARECPTSSAVARHFAICARGRMTRGGGPRIKSVIGEWGHRRSRPASALISKASARAVATVN